MLFVSFILAIIIMVALVRLVENVYQLLVEQMTDHTGFKAFQATFGMLLTLLIAIIALARKFLVLDPKEYDAMVMMAYAAMALSMGIVYWLLSAREDKEKDLAFRI